MKRTRGLFTLLCLCLLFGAGQSARAQHPATLWLEYNYANTNFNPSAGVYVVEVYGAWQDTISRPRATINLNFPAGDFSATNVTVASITDGTWLASKPVFVSYTANGTSYAAAQFTAFNSSGALPPTPRQRIATVTFRYKSNFGGAIYGYQDNFLLASPYTPKPPTGNNQTGFQYTQQDGSLWSGLTADQPTLLHTEYDPYLSYNPPATIYPTYLTIPGGPIDAPFLTKLSKYTAAAGDPGFTLSVYSNNFYAGYVVEWNGSPRPTTQVSQTQFDAQISAADIAKTGTNYVHVRYYPLGTNYTMNLPFVVRTAHIGGKVALEGGANPSVPLTFTLTSPLYGATNYPVTPADDGAFDLGALNPDAYTLSVKNSNSLRVTVAADSTGGAVNNLPLFLPGGDANGDNSVDSSDFTALIGSFNSDATIPGSGYDPTADFNGDGSVDSSDFTILIGNFGRVGDSL